MVTCDENDEEEDILPEIGSVENEEEEYEEHESFPKISVPIPFSAQITV